MEKSELSYEGFLEQVEPAYREFAGKIHSLMLENGCKLKLQLAKNGYVVSYEHSGTKRVAVNFVFRKKGLVIRIYGDNVNKYLDFAETLPEGMLKAIDKAPDCKRLHDFNSCNSRCPMGYDFDVKGTRYKKCRYNCFMFDVNNDNIPFIEEFIEREISSRK